MLEFERFGTKNVPHSNNMRHQTKSKAQRRLFSNTEDLMDNEHVLNIQNMLNEIYERKKAEWDFDFVAGVPLHSPNASYSYTEVPAINMPSFYHTKEYKSIPKTPRKQWPPISYNNLYANAEWEEQENCIPTPFTSQTWDNEADDEEQSDSSLLNESTSSSVSSQASMSFYEQAQTLREHMPMIASASEDEAQPSGQQQIPNVNRPNYSSQAFLRSPPTPRKSITKVCHSPMKKPKSTPRKRIVKATKKSPTLSLNDFFIPQRRPQFPTSTTKKIISDTQDSIISPGSQNLNNMTENMSTLAVVSQTPVRRTSVGARLLAAATRANTTQ